MSAKRVMLIIMCVLLALVAIKMANVINRVVGLI